jgi:hypothetical protein
MKRFLAVLVLPFVAALVTAENVKNSLFDELVNEGIAIPAGPQFKLPTPILMPGTATKLDEALLEKAAGNRPLDLFLKRTVTAPYVSQINTIEGEDEKRCGQLISLRFIAYGKLETVVATDVIKELIGGKEKPERGRGKKVHALSVEELSKRGIHLLDAPGARENYGTTSLSLLDKVQIEGVARGLRTTLPNTVVYATRMDDRFQNDKEFPNRWRAILDAEEGKLGPPQPYSGMAGYVIVTVLPEPKDALLVEMQFLFHEAPDWFGGQNLLRSKLPAAIQENVRGFRRKLNP